VQDDLDALFGVSLETAEHFLTENGELFPFAFAIDDGGEKAMKVAGELEEHPESDVVLAALYDSARAELDQNRAMAFVSAVSIDDGDAVLVSLEHREGGTALELVTPYKIARFRKQPEFGETLVSEGKRRIWNP